MRDGEIVREEKGAGFNPSAAQENKAPAAVVFSNPGMSLNVEFEAGSADGSFPG
jgi:hypothetical protein